MANSFAVLGMVIAEPGVGELTHRFGNPHGFVIHGIEVLKGDEKVTEVIDVKNWRVDNSRLLSIDLEKTDDEKTDDEFVHRDGYVQTDDEETEDEFVQGDEQVNDDEDEGMTNAEDADTGNGDEEISNAAKADAEKTKEVKDDTKKAEFSPSSSSLSVSSGFGDQFLKLSFDTSLIVLTPIPETLLVAPATTLLPPPSVTTIPPVPLQSTTPIPTPPITTKASQITPILKELVDQAWVKHSKDHFRTPTAHDMEILIKTCLMPLALKTQNDSFAFVHELKQEMHADLKYVESLEKEIDELESDKAEFSNMYDILLQECVSNDVMCSYLHSLSDLDAHIELQCLYLHKVKECECLAQKLSKQTETVSKEVYTELL
ncbi:hypothetical protein Tco_1041928 [Tanacetum coccineum]|uniref:Uncharacterized protein n=1 Tax=Tanacetum coccineum TaxID=301880 RepID=A0ABQ5GK96_9ASTR